MAANKAVSALSSGLLGSIGLLFWRETHSKYVKIKVSSEEFTEFVESTGTADRHAVNLRGSTIGLILALRGIKQGIFDICSLSRTVYPEQHNPEQATRNALLGYTITQALDTFRVVKAHSTTLFWHDVVSVLYEVTTSKGGRGPFNACHAYLGLVAGLFVPPTYLSPALAEYVIMCAARILPLAAQRIKWPVHGHTMQLRLRTLMTTMNAVPQILAAAQNTTFLDAAVDAIQILHARHEVDEGAAVVYARFIGRHASLVHDLKKARVLMDDFATFFEAFDDTVAQLVVAQEQVRKVEELRRWSTLRAAWLAAVSRALPVHTEDTQPTRRRRFGKSLP